MGADKGASDCIVGDIGDCIVGDIGDIANEPFASCIVGDIGEEKDANNLLWFSCILVMPSIMKEAKR